LTRFIQHAANRDPEFPPSSLHALQNCLQHEVDWVEIDIIPLKNGDFALLHDPKLENSSNGVGDVFDKTAQEIRKLKHRFNHGFDHEFYLGTLSQAVDLMINLNNHTKLQLDLKPYAPLSVDVMKNLLTLINPVKDRILVSCVADWAIRLLRKMDSSLLLGFDPLLYLDIPGVEPRQEGVPPFRLGAFGYLDDHPLAAQKWGSLKDYFALRAEALQCQVPKDITWFINADLLSDALESGFNWIDTLKENGSKMDAWTIDLNRKDLAKKFIAFGVDYITSNDVFFLAQEVLE